MKKASKNGRKLKLRSIYIFSVLIIAGLVLLFFFGQRRCFGQAVAEKRYKPGLVIQTGHTSLVNTVAFSRDGKMMASGGGDNTVRLWNVETGWQIKSLEGHTNYILALAFSPDGKTLASGGFDASIRLWDVQTGRQIKSLEGHTKQIFSIAFSPDGETLASGSGDNTARLWNLKNGEYKTLTGHTSYVFSVAFSPRDGKMLATGSPDSKIKLWNTATGASIKTLEGHAGEVWSVAFSPDGKTLASADNEGRTLLWNTETWENKSIQKQNSFVYSVAFSPDGKTLAIGGDDKTVQLWDVQKGVQIKSLTGHAQYIRAVAFSPDGEMLASGSGDRTIKLWNARTGERIKSIEGRAQHILSIAFSPDEKMLASVSFDNKIKLWNLETGKQVRALEYQAKRTNVKAINTVAFSADGRVLASDNLEDHTILLWDAATGKPIKSLQGHTSLVYSVAFSPVRKNLLASGGADDIVRLWDWETGSHKLLSGHEKGVKTVAFSQDGKILASGSEDKTIKLWDVEKNELIRSLEGHEDEVSSVVFSPDGLTLASGSGDKTIRLWDVKTGQQRKSLTGHADKINSISFSADGKTLVSGSKDGAVLVWNLASGNCKSLDGHTKEVSAVAFSPGKKNKNLFATGSWDATVKIWRETGGDKPEASLISLDLNDWVVITPDSRFDASADAQNLMHFVVLTELGYEVISLKQLKRKYHKPHLLKDIFADDLKPSNSEFSVTIYPDVSIEQAKPEADTIDLKLTNRGGGIGRVEVKINGSDLYSDVTEGKINRNDSVVNLSVRIPPEILQAGINKGQIIASNGEGDVQSEGKNFYLEKKQNAVYLRGAEIVNSPQTETKLFDGKFYAIIAGVSDYADSSLKLRFAAKDAEDMAQTIMLGARKLFCSKEIEAKTACDRISIRLLSTEKPQAQFVPSADLKQNFKRLEPTKKNFREVFAEIAALAKPEDIVVVYFAGHGKAIKNPEAERESGIADVYLYATSEATTLNDKVLANKAEREATTVSSLELHEWLNGNKRGIAARKKAVIIDTCAAGSVQTDLTLSSVQSRDEGAQQILALERLNERTGLYILMGSAADAASYEASNFRQGLLTYALLEAVVLNQGLDKDRFLDIEKWFSVVGNRVEDLAKGFGGIQSPSFFKSSLGNEQARSFSIGRFDAAEIKAVPLAQPVPVILQPIFRKGNGNTDTFRLSDKLEAHLSSLSETSKRGELLAINYVRAAKSAKGLSPRGSYVIANGIVTVNASLVNADEEEISSFKIEAAENEIVERLAAEIIQKARGNNK
ncbi:MAG TPA: caspase family protein [Pyrinomonadaceae bacterium]|jgi:WD40 repeat protein/uncharacterized caspase-like protein